ncbi:MAG TPA: Flp family type IVb pilin [Micromonosporaceae bacterium]|jgi:pilus assembly protein Flp/PilA|nr:Flp family type IVb pilin [Micromonosporaceae bacterium]
MISLFTYVRAILATRDRGASAAEYALLVAGIAAVIAAIVWIFGNQLMQMFTDSCADVNNGAAC